MDFNKALGLLLFLTFSFQVSVAQELKIDLEEGTLNNSQICSFPLDSLTDLLGRPVSVSDNHTVASITGPQLKYHNLGLEFRFKPKSKDPEQNIWTATIYLTKKWDEEVNEYFIAFEDSLSPNLTANLKAEDVEEIFTENVSLISTAEEHKEVLESIGLSRPKDGYKYTISANYEHTRINLIHEGVTKFLDEVTIECKN